MNNNNRIYKEYKNLTNSKSYKELVSLSKKIKEVENEIYDMNTEANIVWKKLAKQLISSKNELGVITKKSSYGDDDKYILYLSPQGIGWAYKENWRTNRIRGYLSVVDNGNTAYRYGAINLKTLSNKFNGDKIFNKAIDVLDDTRGNDKSVIIKEFWNFVKRGIPESDYVKEFATIYTKNCDEATKIIKDISKKNFPDIYELSKLDSPTIKKLDWKDNISVTKKEIPKKIQIEYSTEESFTIDFTDLYIELNAKHDFYLLEQVQDHIKEHFETVIKHSEKWLKDYKESYRTLQEGLKDYLIQEEMKEMKI